MKHGETDTEMDPGSKTDRRRGRGRHKGKIKGENSSKEERE